jgi:hypothetical protein
MAMLKIRKTYLHRIADARKQEKPTTLEQRCRKNKKNLPDIE